MLANTRIHITPTNIENYFTIICDIVYIKRFQIALELTAFLTDIKFHMRELSHVQCHGGGGDFQCPPNPQLR